MVAFDAAAVPETLGDAGILLPSAAADVVASAVHRVLSDPALANALRAAGAARLELFSPERTAATLLELADALAGGLADPPGLSALRR